MHVADVPCLGPSVARLALAHELVPAEQLCSPLVLGRSEVDIREGDLLPAANRRARAERHSQRRDIELVTGVWAATATQECV